MNQAKPEGNKKKPYPHTGPLCLFCFPEKISVGSPGIRTHANDNTFKRTESRKSDDFRVREGGEFWSKRRKQGRVIRRKMKEPIRNLKGYLLTSANNEIVPQKAGLPSLFEVLETVKDAWPPPVRRNLSLSGRKDQELVDQDNMILTKTKMKEEVYLQFPSPLINRRFSMPEELMRRYSISKEKTSEESEGNKTMMELSSSTSSTIEEESIKKNSITRKVIEKSESLHNVKVKQEDKKDECENISMSELKRVTQNDYYHQGQRIIKVKGAKKNSRVESCSCKSVDSCECMTVSAKEESDESGATGSLASFSPVQLPKHESTSGNMSSESDNMHCTCRELTSSKGTSTDFHSGESTLSQSVSDKSFSTQDSTVSMKSVSTRGSTASDNSMTTTPDRDRTSAKETTSDNSPRTPKSNTSRKMRRDERFYDNHKKSCPEYFKAKQMQGGHGQNCPVHSVRGKGNSRNFETSSKTCATDTSLDFEGYAVRTNDATKKEVTTDTLNGQMHEPSNGLGCEQTEREGSCYTWAKLSQEELYLMQQLRHGKLIEKGFAIPTDEYGETEDTSSDGYTETEHPDESIMIPRYSALPRTLSMLVNTSSGDNSVPNSDSDNQSLADSLEDQNIPRIHSGYFDTKRESKPVRGDVNVVVEQTKGLSHPKGKAFFVHIKDPYGENYILENLKRIPQPPEWIKNQIFNRHLKLCNKHKHLHKNREQKMIHKKRRVKASIVENAEIANRDTKIRAKDREDANLGRKEQKHTSKKREKESEEIKTQKTDKIKGNTNYRDEETQGKNKKERVKKTAKRKRESNEQKRRFVSKIPILVNGRYVPSSPNKEVEIESSRPPEKEEGAVHGVEKTEILKITHSGKKITLLKPQVDHKSKLPLEGIRPREKNTLRVPPIGPVTRIQSPSFHQSHDKQFFLGQARKSPVRKFHQKFEVIPEEKSSSLSSGEDKPGDEALPRFSSTAASPPPTTDHRVNRINVQEHKIDEVPSIIVAEVTGKHLKNLPYVNNEDERKIIFFSSQNRKQNSHSIKGRDALIAMNREDFNRLAKGWMNFYKLNDATDVSDGDTRAAKQKRRIEGKRYSENIPETREKEDGEAIKEEGKTEKETPKNVENDSSTTLSKSSKKQNAFDHEIKSGTKAPEPCPKNRETKKDVKSKSAQTEVTECSVKKEGQNQHRATSLDENIRFHSSNTILRTVTTISPSHSDKVSKKESSLPDLSIPSQKISGSDNEKSSANVLPKVRDSVEDGGESSDSDSTDYMEPPSPRVPPLPLEENPGWSVTVAGTVELSRSAPDLEMRLSFPTKSGPPVACQSDSGFAEDFNYSRPGESLKALSTSRKDSSSTSKNLKHRWTVTVNNPIQGSAQNTAKLQQPKNSNRILPELEPQNPRSTKTTLKVFQEDSLKRVVTRKLYAIWPKVQRVIQEEFLANNQKWVVTELPKDFSDSSRLEVKGNAILPERRQARDSTIKTATDTHANSKQCTPVTSARDFPE